MAGAIEAALLPEVLIECRRIGERVHQAARALAPVDTGELRDSGEVTSEADSVLVEFTAPYAAFVEFGHHTASGSFVPPQAFLRPAADSVA